jgi:hypothetical protein
MSWLYSRALVEAFSAGNCSAGEPSAQWSTTPMPQGFSARAKTMGYLNRSLSGQMFAPSTADHGEALLTWFRAASRARTSASQERAPALKESAPDSGPTWRELWARFDPVSCSWRTLQRSLFEGSGELSPTWPRSGMAAVGECWALTMLEPITSETDSGSWPTPTVCGNYNRKGASAKSGDGLATAVQKWLTPTVVERWCKDDTKIVTTKNGTRRREYKNGKTSSLGLAAQVGGALNPTWVEWLMGWPMGWTDLKPLETGRCPSAQPQPGECFLAEA